MVKEKEHNIDTNFNSLDEKFPYDEGCFKRSLISTYVEEDSSSAEDFLDNYYTRIVSVRWSDVLPN